MQRRQLALACVVALISSAKYRFGVWEIAGLAGNIASSWLEIAALTLAISAELTSSCIGSSARMSFIGRLISTLKQGNSPIMNARRQVGVAGAV